MASSIVANSELGSFLRRARDRVQPEDVGIVRRPRRRVAGLRRHEVADLAGVSLTWYTWLEQGRDVHPSADVLDAITKALALDEDSRRYVRRLAGVPVIESPTATEEPADGLMMLLSDLEPVPAYIVTPTFDFAAWNAVYSRLFVDPVSLPQERRNALWMFFTRAEIRDLLPDLGRRKGPSRSQISGRSGAPSE